MANVDKMVNELLDEREIEKVMVRMARGLDGSNWDDFTGCFAETININYEMVLGRPETRAPAALWTSFARAVQNQFKRQHTLSNFLADIDGGRATGMAYFAARVRGVTDFGATNYTEFGFYRAWLVKIDGRWVIERIMHKLNWIDGNTGLLDVGSDEIQKYLAELFTPERIASARQLLESDPALSDIRTQYDIV